MFQQDFQKTRINSMNDIQRELLAFRCIKVARIPYRKWFPWILNYFPLFKDVDDWVKSIREASTQAEEALSRIRELGEQKNIAKELSDLVIYCVTVPFNVNREFLFTFVYNAF